MVTAQPLITDAIVYDGLPMVYQWSYSRPANVYNGLQWFTNGLPSDTNGIPMVCQLSRTIGQTME